MHTHIHKYMYVCLRELVDVCVCECVCVSFTYMRTSFFFLVGQSEQHMFGFIKATLFQKKKNINNFYTPKFMFQQT